MVKSSRVWSTNRFGTQTHKLRRRDTFLSARKLSEHCCRIGELCAYVRKVNCAHLYVVLYIEIKLFNNADN